MFNIRKGLQIALCLGLVVFLASCQPESAAPEVTTEGYDLPLTPLRAQKGGTVFIYVPYNPAGIYQADLYIGNSFVTGLGGPSNPLRFDLDDSLERGRYTLNLAVLYEDWSGDTYKTTIDIY